MAINKRLLVKPPSTGITPSEHFGVVLYEGDGSSSHSINGGKFGAAFYGNGSSSKIDIGNLNLGGDAERTISAWINTNSLSSTQTIFQYGANSNGARFGFSIDTSGKPFIEYYNRDVTTSSSHISVNTWYHLVVTYNGNAIETATNTQIYVNGSAVSMTTSGAQTGSANTTDSNYGIGYDRLNTRQYFSGKLDQVRIFSKALSSSEVSTLYAETASTVESLDPLSEDTTDTLQVLGDSSCTSLYRFENNETDLSGNYNGTGNEIQYAAGRYGQAVSVGSSTTSYVDIPTTTTPTTSSISLWVKTSQSDNQWRIIADGGGSQSSGTGWALFKSGDGDFINVYFTDGQTGYSQSHLGNIALDDGLWHHIVLSMASDDTYAVYLDGASHLTGTRTRWTSGDTHSVSSVRFGNIIATTANANNQFYGEIDQIRTFNKALSASEVTTLYQENSLVASYRFEGNALDDMRAYDGTATNVTYEYGLNFTPDFVWIKSRTGVRSHALYDSTRGANKRLVSNGAQAEISNSAFASFDSGGFTVTGTDSSSNTSGEDYAAWAWKANGGTTSSNTDGTITSTVQVNQDAGFSIVQYTGNGNTATQTIGHGLSSAPELIIQKSIDLLSTYGTNNWVVGGTILGAGGYMFLNSTNAKGVSADYWSNTIPTDSVFSVSGGPISTRVGNELNKRFINYCFYSVEGFSKIGSYTGNGSTNGPIVETGFEPAFIMAKQTDDAANWVIVDNKRSTTNPRDKGLRANTSDTESTVSNNMVVDFLSNGFKLKQTSGSNANNGNFIYMAFAADPDTEQPTVAKSFSTVAWTGDGTARDIPVGFKPNLVWIKSRSFGRNHYWYDSIRGANKQILSNATDAEATITGRLTAFNTDSFSIGTSSEVNNNNETYVAWAWKADDNEPTIFGGPALAVYKFEDNVNDVTGDYNATASNISYTSSGKFNKAADFNGTNSYVETSLTTNLTSFTWSCWINPDVAWSGDITTIVKGFYSGASNTNYQYLGYTGGDFRFQFRDNTTTAHVSSSVTPAVGEWSHIVATVDGGTSIKIYINGVLTGSGTNSRTISNTNAVSIGGASSIFGPFNGQIDQVRIYQGAIAQEQVDELYAETASDNDDLTLGAPPKSIVSANANAGFSIVKYEGDGVSGKQVPHGLSAAPDFIVVKSLDSIYNWMVYASPEGENKHAYLNLTNVFEDPSLSVWNDTAPTSTVFSISNNANVNLSGENYIAYCFHSVSGYSKIGSYTGNASTNAITGLGFQPDWILARRTNTADNWAIIDSVRETYLLANLTDTEATYNWFEFTSDGFTLSTSTLNASGGTYIYMAFKIN